jgi:fatty-acid desaturase
MSSRKIDQSPAVAGNDIGDGAAAIRDVASLPRLPLPDAVLPGQIDWPYASTLIVFHLLALLAFVPWFFSWTGVILCAVSGLLLGLLGINLCFHRLLTHRGLKCPKWFEHTLAVLGVCCVQDTPMRWVAIHRRHHEHADESPDPHSPLVNFFWGHVGWLLVENREHDRLRLFDRYTKDLMRDPFYVGLERNYNYYKLLVASWLVVYAAGVAAELLLGGTLMEAVQFGLSLLVWGVFLRTVLVWHQTWAVNSLSHMWGYRNYATDEGSRNNWFVGILSNGEGWHNNHHADPRSAKHGHLWWELDITYVTIRVLAAVGLATNVARPRVIRARDTARIRTRATQETQASE